jgi:hypothetical protein
MSTNPTNLSPNLAGVLYFGIFFKKLYLLYIGMEGLRSTSVKKFMSKFVVFEAREIR